MFKATDRALEFSPMRRCSLLLALLVCACAGASDVSEGEAEPDTPFELGQPLRVECQCVDRTTFHTCTRADACAGGGSLECEAGCAVHGGLVVIECPPHLDVSCLLHDKNIGPNAVLCTCGGFDARDGGGCTSLSCGADADDIESVCSAYCPTSAPQALCVASPSCESGGAPPGRDATGCQCNDGTTQTACTAAVCGEEDRFAPLCETLCAGHEGFVPSGFTCEPTEIECALGGDDGSPRGNAVSCNCLSAGNVGACTALDCDDDAATIQSACDDACAARSNPPGASAPTCAPDPSCSGGGPAAGPDFSFCHCADDTLFEFCTAGCLDCTAEGVCDDHGGLSNRLVEGCSQSELTCALGAEGGPNAIGCRCDGQGQVTTRCGPIACDDEAALAAACDEACFGVPAEGFCTADDAGCAVGRPPSGPHASVCGCGDGTSVTTCVADCNAPTLSAQCFPLCADQGGFTDYGCAPSAACE